VEYCDEHVCVCVYLSVCLSVCENVCPRAYLRSHMSDLYQFFVHVAYGHGSILLLPGDEILKGRGLFLVFLSPMTVHCNVFAAKRIIPYQLGRSDGSVQRRQSVIYDCVVVHCCCRV